MTLWWQLVGIFSACQAPQKILIQSAYIVDLSVTTTLLTWILRSFHQRDASHPDRSHLLVVANPILLVWLILLSALGQSRLANAAIIICKAIGWRLANPYVVTQTPCRKFALTFGSNSYPRYTYQQHGRRDCRNCVSWIYAEQLTVLTRPGSLGACTLQAHWLDASSVLPPHASFRPTPMDGEAIGQAGLQPQPFLLA